MRSLQAIPSILAIPLHEYEQEPSPSIKLWCAVDVVELSYRFATMVGLAELRHDGALPEALRRGELRARST